MSQATASMWRPGLNPCRPSMACASLLPCASKCATTWAWRLKTWVQIEHYYREALVLQPDLEAAIAGLALSLEIQSSVFGKSDTAAAKQKEAVALAKAALLR